MFFFSSFSLSLNFSYFYRIMCGNRVRKRETNSIYLPFATVTAPAAIFFCFALIVCINIIMNRIGIEILHCVSNSNSDTTIPYRLISCIRESI